MGFGGLGAQDLDDLLSVVIDGGFGVLRRSEFRLQRPSVALNRSPRKSGQDAGEPWRQRPARVPVRRALHRRDEGLLQNVFGLGGIAAEVES